MLISLQPFKNSPACLAARRASASNPTMFPTRTWRNLISDDPKSGLHTNNTRNELHTDIMYRLCSDLQLCLIALNGGELLVNLQIVMIKRFALARREEEGRWSCKCGADKADMWIRELDTGQWRWRKTTGTPSAEAINKVVCWRIGRLVEVTFFERSRLSPLLARFVCGNRNIEVTWDGIPDQPKATTEMHSLGKELRLLDCLQCIAAMQDRDYLQHCLPRS